MFFLKILDDQDQQLELMERDYRSPMPDGLRWAAWAGDPEGLTGDGLLAFINSRLFPSLKNLSPAGRQERRQQVVRAVFEDAYNYMKSGHLLRQVINKINEIDFNDLAEREHFGDVYEQLLNDLQSAGRLHGRAHRSPPGGDSPRPRLRHWGIPDLLDPAYARALCQNA
jgi:type I restriction enzyme M protein